MARSSTGRTVARAAATGGGATYRGQMPVNWYAALVLIVVLGAASVVFARYNYTKGAPSVPPTVGQTWHAALQVDICGKVVPALPANTNASTVGLTTTGNGLLLVAPKTGSEAGNNATLGKFASEYGRFTLTNSTLGYPGAAGPVYHNGQKCPTGTPDAGQKGVVKARTWILSPNKSTGKVINLVGGAYASNPSNIKFASGQLITLGFVPANKSLPKVSGLTELALLQAIEGTTPVATPTTTTTPTTGSTTTTPTSVTTTTTAHTSTTTSTTASTTTTKPSTTTTTK
jgi:hypothetical protein